MNVGHKGETRRLQPFLHDLALLGSLQGFRYFQPWLRGREELLLTVVNEDQSWYSPGFALSAASSSNSSNTSSNASSPLEAHQDSSRSSEAHLLPASPSEREISVPELNHTLFLLAGYAHYGRPYAWIRSNPSRLIDSDSLLRDTPIKLKSLTDWTSQGTQVWDVVSELVGLCTIPPPENPFSLDMSHLLTLIPQQRVLASGALLLFLETLLVLGSRQEPYYSRVLDDVEKLRRLHVKSLQEVQRLQ